MSDQINNRRHGLIGASLITFATADFGQLDAVDASSGSDVAGDVASEGYFPSLEGATAWLNSQPLQSDELRSKVVAIDFWTYTCINWRRTLPYVRGWAENYHDHGLVVIGVHTPEFPVEHDIENVRHAVQDMGVTYPVAIDNEYAVWDAFNNRFWPALYLVDAQGRIRHHQFGEGDYEEAERIIQQLLVEAGDESVGHDLVAVDARGAEVAADWNNLASGENYVGYERTENFVSPGGAALGKHRIYTVPARLEVNEWALSGDWTMERGFAALNAPDGRITYRFHARDLHLVMGPAKPGTAVRFRVLIDGRPPGAAHGGDVDEQGNGMVSEPRLYQLIRQQAPIRDRLFEVAFLDAGVEVYAFTFG